MYCQTVLLIATISVCVYANQPTTSTQPSNLNQQNPEESAEQLKEVRLWKRSNGTLESINENHQVSEATKPKHVSKRSTSSSSSEQKKRRKNKKCKYCEEERKRRMAQFDETETEHQESRLKRQLPIRGCPGGNCRARNGRSASDSRSRSMQRRNDDEDDEDEDDEEYSEEEKPKPKKIKKPKPPKTTKLQDLFANFHG